MLIFLGISLGLGLLFGSLSTVLTERWHSRKGGILMGRSECPHCHHVLGGWELIPVFSYIFQLGRCKHCKANISPSYPLSECLMAIIFAVLSYKAWFWGYDLLGGEHILLLILGFITGVYIIYDIRYREIPDQIMVPGLWLIIILSTLSIYYEDVGTLFFDFTSYSGSTLAMIGDHIQGAIILYTFLYLQILIPGGWYLLRKKQFRSFMELIISYVTFPFMLLFGFFISGKKHDSTDTEEIPTWVGGGDLRIALFIGLTLGSIHGIASFFIAYIVGSIIGIYLLIRGGATHTEHQIAFGPFLGIGWLGAIVFHAQILVAFSLYFSNNI